MPKRTLNVDIGFPMSGLSDNASYHKQERGTTPEAQNVRGYEMVDGRARGGQRPGLTKYLSSRQSANQVQEITHMATSNADSASPTSAVTRDVTAVAVTNGTVAKFNGTQFTTATNGSGALDANAPWIDSTSLLSVLYFADGTSAKKYTPSSNTVAAWSASAGSLPINGSDYPRLITTWRARIVQSGLKGDRHNWFMSAVNDADDWDYSPATTVETQAVAGNNSDAGKVGDIINTLIAYNDDLLIFGCDQSIWQMTSDPAAGGRIDLISDVTGMAFGDSWCKTPEGMLYFFGSRGGVYMMAPGNPPQRLSANRIEERLASVDLSTTLIKMVWDDRQQGFYLFITPLDGSSTTHYFFDARNSAWWPDVLASQDFNPTAVHVYDGDTSSDRAILLGGRDGYIRKVDIAGKSDDGVAIDSFVRIGPLGMPRDPHASVLLKELQATLGTSSDGLSWAVHQGDSAQDAAAAGASFATGTWAAGRNYSERCRVSGNSLFLRLRNNTLGESWQLETVRASLREMGHRRQRFIN